MSYICLPLCSALSFRKVFFLAWVQDDLLITSLFSIFHYKRIRSTQTYLIFIFFRICICFISYVTNSFFIFIFIFWWSSINTYMKLVCIYDINNCRLIILQTLCLSCSPPLFHSMNLQTVLFISLKWNHMKLKPNRFGTLINEKKLYKNCV